VNTSLLVAESTSLAASIVLLMNGYGLLALGVGPLIRELLLNLLSWPILVRMLRGLHIRPVVSRAYIKSMTGQMSWTFVNNLSGVMRRNVDALIVSQVFGNSAVLLVEWTKRAWEIFASVVTRASTSFTPALAHLYGEADLPKFRTISAQLFAVTAVALGIALAVGLALNQSFVGLWVGTQFYAGNQYNLVLGLAMVASAIGFTLLEVLFATGNIRRPAIAQLLQTVARLGVLFALVPMVGLLSIPLSMLITESLGILYLSLEWQRTLKVAGHDMLKQLLLVGRALLVAVVLAQAWMWLPHATSWLQLVLHGVLFGTMLVLAFYLVEPFVRIRVNGMFLLLLSRAKN
jgi:O-antigen/teichoic acid export membrane protein